MIYKTKTKAQSMLDYVITLAAIVGFIVAGTIGFRNGVKKSLDSTQTEIKKDLDDRDYVGEEVEFDADGNPITEIKD